MAREAYRVPELKYAPATRGASNALVMLCGTWGTGKTRSALEIATGLAGKDGLICFADTEHGRARAYAENFKFEHLDLREPYRSDLFEEAANVAQRRGASVWICDNFSWEHVGPGGQLEWHEQQLDQLAGAMRGQGTIWEKRERVKMLAWVEPKAAHQRMLQRFWQLNCHIILCVQAKKKIEMVRDQKSGKVTPTDVGYQPNCAEDIPYAMTTAMMLWPGAPGVPTILKPNEFLDPLIPLDRPLSQDVGRAIAAWCRGEQPEAPKASEKREATGAARERQIADELIGAYRKVETRAQHLALVEDARMAERVTWFQKRRPALFTEINQAVIDAWTRTEPAGEERPPPDEGAPADGPPDDPTDPGFGEPAEKELAL